MERDTDDDERIIDPFDPAKIRVETRTMTIDLLLARIDHRELDLTPGFQRKGGIWNEFKKAIDNGIRDDRMADRECVLRFLSFTIFPYKSYKAKEFDGFLNDRMADINKMTGRERENLKQQFFRAMTAASTIFGNDAFRKRYRPDASRYPINKALFECWSVGLNQLDDRQLQNLEEQKSTLLTKFMDTMLNDHVFENAISQGTGDISKVKKRFSTIEQLIKEVLVAKRSAPATYLQEAGSI